MRGSDWRALIWLSAAGCSLFVNFNTDQIPKDAAPDAFMPFTTAECDFGGGSNFTPAAAFPISPGVVGPAALCPIADGGVSGPDYYSFVVPEDVVSVAIGLTFPATSNGNLDLLLYDGSGDVLIGESVGFGSTQMLVCPGVSPPCTQLPAASYLMEVEAGVGGDFNSYMFSLAFTMGSGSGSGSD